MAQFAKGNACVQDAYNEPKNLGVTDSSRGTRGGEWLPVAAEFDVDTIRE